MDDIKAYEAVTERYLFALLETPSMEERDIAKLIGVDNETVDRISESLESKDIISWLGGYGQYRRIYELSTLGREHAEKMRYEKTPLAKRRAIAAAGGGLAKVAGGRTR